MSAALARLAGALETLPSPGGVWEPPARPWLMSSLDLRVPSAGRPDSVTAAEWAGCAGLGVAVGPAQPGFSSKLSFQASFGGLHG